MPLWNASVKVIGILALMAVTSAYAADDAAPAARPTATAAASQPLLCRDRLRPGSHIAMRTCLTAAQWAASYARGYTPRAPYPRAFVDHGGAGAWGQVSTAGASVGMSAFTAR